jgi:hypothetical protein
MVEYNQQFDKFGRQAPGRYIDPAEGMFDSSTPKGLPVGQVAGAVGGMGLKAAMDFVNNVREGKIDPSSDEGLKQTLMLALQTIGLRGGAARPGGVSPALTSSAAAESAAPRMLALPPPKAGPSSPVGRGLSGEPIAAGRPPANPATDYRLASEQGQRIGPSRPSAALRPEVNEMFTLPEQLNLKPEVTTTPTPLQQLRTESPMQAERAGATRTAHEEFLADLRAADEARATGEGMREPGQRFPIAPPEAPPARPMSAPATEPTVSPFQERPAPGVARRPAPPAPAPMQFGLGGPKPVSAVSVDPLTGRAYQPRSFQSGAGQATGEMVSPITGEALPSRLLNEPPATAPAPARAAAPVSAEEGIYAQTAADRVAAEARAAAAAHPEEGVYAQTAADRAVNQAKANAAAAQRAEYTPREAPVGQILGYGGAGTAAAIMGAKSIAGDKPVFPTDKMMPGYSANTPGDWEAFQKMFPVNRPAPAQDYSQFSEYGDPSKMFEGNYANFQREGSLPLAANRTISTARDTVASPAGASSPATRNAPAVASAPARTRDDGGILSKIFSGSDYQSSGGNLTYKKGDQNVVNWGSPESAADFFRADAAARAMKDKDIGFTGRSGSDIDYQSRTGDDQNFARGGKAEQKPTKEALIHKSLEIIHHMLKSR